MKKLIDYSDDDEYHKHQLKKTLDKDRIKKSNNNRVSKVNKFIRVFNLIQSTDGGNKVLCVGSRDGEEVEAARRLGFDAIGIDLESLNEFTIKMDMHNLEFKDNTFVIVYSNSLDHSNNIKRALSEIIRVLKPGGVIILEIKLHNKGDYEVVEFESSNDILKILDNLGIEYGYNEIMFINEFNNRNIKMPCIYSNHRTLLLTIKSKNAKIK